MANRGRIGFQEGGNAAFNTVNGIPLDEWLKNNFQYEKVPVTDKYGNPTFDNSGRQNFTAIVKQEYIGDNPLFDWNTGKSTTPTTEIPTVDSFSGQQVSAQEQTAFAQPQTEIFPQQELPTVQPKMFQPYQEESSNVGIFSGPAYDKYSQARTDAYANAPSKFDYDVNANQAAGQFVQDRAREIYGDNIFGKGIGALGTIASIPLAFYSSPFHEAAQVVKEGRMEPGSGIQGFYKALLNELPFETAANRAAGVLKSVPGIGEPIYSGAYKLGQGLGNLTLNDPILSSLTKNFNNLTLQEMDKIRNTSREQLIEQARSTGQKGGMGYLLGF
jgi:hypothetical protein